MSALGAMGAGTDGVGHRQHPGTRRDRAHDAEMAHDMEEMGSGM
jgi:hypothetical protein